MLAETFRYKKPARMFVAYSSYKAKSLYQSAMMSIEAWGAMGAAGDDRALTVG